MMDYIQNRIFSYLIGGVIIIGSLYVIYNFFNFKPKKKEHNLELNKFGVWLWYLHHTGFDSHDDLAYHLSDMGVKRIYIKVANGGDLKRWPELIKRNVPNAYYDNGIEPWAWSYNYPGNEDLQAQALYFAAKTGYKSFVVDIEKELDNRPDAAEKLFLAFYKARQRALEQGLIDSTFKIYVTTWGNPRDHNTPVAIIDKYVDGFMPQTYVEAWGKQYIDNIPYWISAGTREYIEMGATKPIIHIASTEYDVINSHHLNEFLLHAGKEASLWRIPGGGVPQKVWKDWYEVNWDMNLTDTMPKPNFNQVYLLDSLNKEFGLNYKGPFTKMVIKDSTGFITKELTYNSKNIYKAPDLCKGKYTIEIIHGGRVTFNDLEIK